MLRSLFLVIFVGLLVSVVSASVPADAPESLVRLDSAAAAGEPAAMFRYAALKERGYPPYVERDSVMARELYFRAADKGYAPAEALVGYFCYDPASPSRDVAKALHYTERAAMQGDAKAANNLGWMLLEGDGVVHDAAKAAYWFGKGADAGLPVAQAQLADLYRAGKGVERDTLKAVALYEDAIAGGLADAQNKLLAMMMPFWQKSLTDSEAVSLARHYLDIGAPGVAVPLMELGAASGNPDAFALLGDAYSRASGVEYDHAKALEYYFRSAVGGNPSAQFVIGELLEVFPDALKELPSGISVSADMIVPQYWYELAALKGVTTASEAAGALRIEK